LSYRSGNVPTCWINERPNGCPATGRTIIVGENCHPFPATLDGAASAMPEGWWWHKYHQTPRGLEYSAGRKGEKGYTFAPDTGNEINDRHLLAALAVQAEMETKR
jgi:hypothetical protein